MASVPTFQTRDLYAPQIIALANRLANPTPLDIQIVRKRLLQLAQG